MGVNQQNNKPGRRSQRDAARDEQIRQQLQQRREERRRKEELRIAPSMQRKNTTMYRTNNALDTTLSPRGGLAPRRERTRAQRLKTELITRAKTKDHIRERNLRNFVTGQHDTRPKDPIDIELYRIEQQMHIYLQTQGIEVNTSDFSKLRPRSRVDTTLNSTNRNDTTLKSAKSSRKSAKKAAGAHNTSLNDSKRSIPPWHRREYVLNKREADMYQKINQVYRNDKLRENRETAFLKKVEALQVEEWKRLWGEYDRKLRDRDSRRMLQQQQLQDVRQKYADDRWDRIARFPVNRVVVHDEADRHEYGLPGDLNEDPVEYVPKVGSERKPNDVSIRRPLLLLFYTMLIAYFTKLHIL